jgi:hypothetical protein
LKDQAIAMEELNRQLSSLNALGTGQLGARKNLPPPQHAQVPIAGSTWKPPGVALPPPPASAFAPPAAPLRIPAPPAAAAKAAKQLDLTKKLGKPKK